jgi:hypothetical protein
VTFLLVLPLALAGAVGGAARRAPRWFWLTPVLLFASVVFIVGETRMRAPVDAFVVLLAALAVTQLVPGRRRPAQRPGTGGVDRPGRTASFRG